MHFHDDTHRSGPTKAIYSTAADLGIKRVVLTSSVNAIGNANIPWHAWPVTEDMEFSYGHLYCLTKHCQEDIARRFADLGVIRTLALRPSTFAPTDETSFGFGLVNGRAVTVADVAAAHLAAALVISGRRTAGGPMAMFEAFHTTYQPPYTRRDVEDLGPENCPAALLKKYWPDRFQWLIERGYDSDLAALAVYDNAKAKRLLGWEAQDTAEKWLAGHSGLP
jgi:nucleoside-diphosphate-sugar epimerase